MYKFNENEMIIDAITKAGGLTKYATTTNINLSKKLIPEMVIYIFTKNELKKKEPETIIINNVPECKCEVIEVNNCVNEPIIDNSSTIDQTSSTTDSTSSSEVISKLININTSNLMELQQLPGIGESKANLIIQYRNTIGLFTKIEDIKNVSGIGDATYKNIKDLIKV